MKSILIATTVVLFAAAAGGQTLTKPPAKAVGLGKSEVGSNGDMNIRAYIELLRTDVKRSKAQIMGDVMQLDAGQSAKFWPIYKDFESDLSALGDKVVTIIKTYAENYLNLTDPVADSIATQILEIETQRNELKKKYYERFKTAVGAVVAARFLQVENQLERLIDLQIAAELPVVSQ
jgi:hypothetical protein